METHLRDAQRNSIASWRVFRSVPTDLDYLHLYQLHCRFFLHREWHPQRTHLGKGLEFGFPPSKAFSPSSSFGQHPRYTPARGIIFE